MADAAPADYADNNRPPLEMQLAPLFEYIEAVLLQEPAAVETWLDMQKLSMPETAWFLRMLLQSIVPPGYTQEALLAGAAGLFRFNGKAVDAANFAQYAQPIHLNAKRAQNLITVFDHLLAFARKLLKYIRDRERGLSPEIPQIKNLYKQLISD